MRICDVNSGTQQHTSSIISVVASKYRDFFCDKMPERCVVYGCNNTRNISEGISLHVVPFFDDERQEAKKQRKKWVDFVCRMRSKWTPSRRSVICSAHFKLEDFSNSYARVGEESSMANRWLQRDDFRIIAFPTVYAIKESQTTDRDKRMVSL